MKIKKNMYHLGLIDFLVYKLNIHTMMVYSLIYIRIFIINIFLYYMDDYYKYIYYFILGGTVVSLIKYISSTDNIKLCCVIPAIPIFFPLTIYMFRNKKKDEIKRYIKGSILSFSVFILFLIIFYFSYSETENIINAYLVSMIFFILFIFIIWKFI